MADIHLHPTYVLLGDKYRNAIIRTIEEETGLVFIVKRGRCLFVPGRKPPVLRKNWEWRHK